MIGFFLWAAAVALTDKHAPLSSITFDFIGNVDPTVASFIFFIWCEVLCVFPFWVIVFFNSIEQLNCFNWTIELPFVEKLNHCLSPLC